MADKKQNNNQIIIPEPADDKTPIIIEDDKNTPDVSFSNDGLKVKKGANVFIGRLNIFVNPVKKRWHRHYHPKNKRWYLHLTVDAVLALIILGLISLHVFLIIERNNIGLVRQVQLSVAQENGGVISAQANSFLINYQNNTKKQLNNAKLSVKLPEKFVLISTEPANIFTDHTRTFDLGNIVIGGNGQVKITGLVLTALGETDQLSATLSFVPEGYSKILNQAADKNFTIEKSNLNLSIKIPEQVYNHQTFSGELTYTNNSKFDFDKITVIPTFDNGRFELISAAPELVNNEWTIANIKAGQSGKINFTGRFNVDANTAKITNSFAWTATYNNQDFNQKAVGQEITIRQSQVNAQLLSEQDKLTAGGQANYVLKIKNNEKYPIKNIRVTFVGQDFEKQSIWDKSRWPDLTNINPGEEKTIAFNVKLKTDLTPSSADERNVSAQASVNLDYSLENGRQENGYTVSNTIQQKIITDLKLIAVARYFTDEGDQLGIGPVPPIVGLATKYWIGFKITNQLNDVKDIKVTAKLGKNISWTGRFSTTNEQKINYDENNNLITWLPENVSAPSSLFPTVGANFEVELTPTANQVGQTANLIEAIEISGTDAFTGENIHKVINNLTTNLTADRLEISGGIVQGRN